MRQKLILSIWNDVRPLALILPKMNECVKIFEVKDGDKDKNNELISFCINDEKLLKNIKPFWLNWRHRYTEIKIRTYGYKVHHNFRGLNLPEDDIECESTLQLILYFFTKTNITWKYI